VSYQTSKGVGPPQLVAIKNDSSRKRAFSPLKTPIFISKPYFATLSASERGTRRQENVVPGVRTEMEKKT